MTIALHHSLVLSCFLGFLQPSAGKDQVAKGAQSSFANFDQNGEARITWLEKYRSAKSRCTWVQDIDTLELKYDWFPSDEVMKDSYWSYLTSQFRITTYYPDLPLWLEYAMSYFFKPAPHGPALHSQSCMETDPDGGEFRIRRLGPFLGNGGFDWHKMKLEDPYNLRSRLHGGDASMTAFTVMPVDEHGEILGNPPVHIHHANLGPNPNRSSLSRVSQWHGDSQCADTSGGTACYSTVLPEGFGFPLSQELRLDVDFNDVRPAQSSDLLFWLETAISLAPPKLEDSYQDVGTVIIGVPFRAHWWKVSDFQRLYFIPADEPSALWVTGRMPTSGTFVAGKLETHQHMFDKAMVFSGVSPEDLGLNSEAWHLEKPWLPWAPSENGWTSGAAAMQALKSDVQARFGDAVQRCAEQLLCEKTPSLVWTLDSVVIEDGEDREMPWPETSWTFDEGEQFTIVIFHKGMKMPGKEKVTEFPQHLAITGYYLPESGAKADYFFVMPSSNADWAWLNSVHWLVALVNHGGAPVGFFSWCGPVSTVLILGALLALVWRLTKANLFANWCKGSRLYSKVNFEYALDTQVVSDEESSI